MAKQESSYRIEVNRHIIVIHSVGSQGVDGVRDIRGRVEDILKESRHPKDILVTQSGHVETFDELTVQATIDSFREVPFRRLAIVGTQPNRIIMTHGMMTASGPSERFKIFRDEALARQWLNEKPGPLTKLASALSKATHPGKIKKKQV